MDEPKEFVEDLDQQELDSVHATAGRYPDDVANAGLDTSKWERWSAPKRSDIYFDDLVEDAQRRLLAEAGISSPEEANWDSAPIATVVFDFDIDNDGDDNYD